MFEIVPDGDSIKISPLATIVPKFAKYLNLFGRLIAKSLLDENEIKSVKLCFSRNLLKNIIGEPLSFIDLKQYDSEIYRHLNWILENDIKEDLQINFELTTKYLGVIQNQELCENGKNIRVNNENKKEYVKCFYENKLINEIKEALNNFLSGFYEIIPKKEIQLL